MVSATNPYAKPRPDITDADFKRMRTPIGPKAPKDAAPRAGSFFRGAARRASDLMGSAGELAYEMSLAPGNRRTQQYYDDPTVFDANPEMVRGANALSDQIGATEATDDRGKGFEMAGEYMTDAALTAPLVGFGAAKAGIRPAAAIIGEMLAAGGGGLAHGTLEAEGEENLGLAAGVGISMLGAPAAGGAAKADTVARLISSAARNMTPDALPYMEKLGVGPMDLAHGSSEIKRDVPDVPAYIEALTDAERRTEGMPGGIRSRQVADAMPNSRGGGGMAQMDESLSRSDKDVRRKAALQRADYLDNISERWDELSRADPDYPEFLVRYDEGQQVLKMEERGAWKAVREGELPTFDISDVQDAAASVIDGVRYKRGDVPKVLLDLVDEAITPTTTIDLDRMQELRSVLLGVVRDAKLDPKSANKHASQMAVGVLEHLNEQIDQFARVDVTGKSQEYQRARALTAANAEMYDPASTVINSLEKGGTPKSLFSRLRGAQGRKGARTTPVQEAEKLVRIAEQTPDGMANLRALAISDLFYDGLVPTATHTPQKILKANEDLYRVVLGADYDEAINLLELSRLGATGKAGTAAQAASVGSGVSPAKFLFGLARAQVDPISAAVEGAMKLVSGKLPKGDLMYQAIITEALADPKFMRILMQMPTKRALPAWKIQWTQLVARASARSAGRAGARHTIGGDSPQEVNK